MKKITRYIICLMLSFFMLLGTADVIHAAEEKEKNTIALVYDDSGSMMSANKTMVDRWCHAKYALGVFSTMMLEDDVMTVYPMNNTGASFSMKGSDSAEKRKKQVEDFEIIYGSYTPYDSVSSAYQKISSVSDNTTKWLVVITDGDFTGTTYDEANTQFEEYASSGINVVYLRIYDTKNGEANTSNDRSSKIINQPEKNIYVYEALKSADTLERVNEISNLIFKRQALSKYPGVLSKTANSVTMNIDVPVSQLVVFAQGENIQAGEITGPKKVKKNSAIQVTTPEIPTNVGKLSRDEMLVADGLGGVVATYSSSDAEALPVGVYTLDISDTSNVEVYCKLAVDVEVKITQDGQVTEGGDKIYSGDYEVEIILRDPITGNEIDPSAKLISDAEYEIKVTNSFNDEKGTEPKESIFKDVAFKDTLTKGKASVQGKIKLGDSYVNFEKNYEVVDKLDELMIQYAVPTEGINLEELEDRAVGISVKVLEGGEVLSEDKAGNLEFMVSTSKNVEFEVVRGSEPGTYMIYPLYKGTIETTDSGIIPFELAATLNYDGQQNSAKAEGNIELYINLVPVDISFVVPMIEAGENNKKDEAKTGYVINTLTYVKSGTSTDNITIPSDFKYTVAECKIDGRPFTAEEWAKAKVNVYLVDNETGEKIEDKRFSVVFEKGSGENVSKILIAPVSHVKNDLFYLRARNIILEAQVSFDYLGSTCKDAARVPLTIDTLGWGLVIFWGPILAITVGILWLIWSMTLGKCWNRPKPEFVIKKWNHGTGDAPEIVKSGKVSLGAWSSLLPMQPVQWKISSGDGMPSISLQAMPNGYKVLNPQDLINRKVLKNTAEIPVGTKNITVNNTTKLSVFTKNTPRQKNETILYLHKRPRNRRQGKRK